MIKSDATARLKVGHCKVLKWPPSTFTFSTNSAGTLATERPKKSFTCVVKISTAIPEVNPIVTGYGMNLITDPNLTKPMTHSMIPAITVQIARLPIPYRERIP